MRFLLHGAGAYVAIIALFLLFGGEGLQRAMLEMSTAAPYALIVILLALFVAVLCAMQAVGLDGEGRTEERRTPPTRRQAPKEPEKKPRTAKKQAEKAPAARSTGKRTKKSSERNPKSSSKRRSKSPCERDREKKSNREAKRR